MAKHQKIQTKHSAPAPVPVPPPVPVRAPAPVVVVEPEERLISEHAYRLYQAGGSLPGNDLEHWYKARDSLKIQSPEEASVSRPHPAVSVEQHERLHANVE